MAEAEQVQAEEEGTEKVAEAAVASEQPQPQVMRAAIYRRYGSPDELEVTSQHPKPKCVKKRDVLVRVHATSINPVDWKLMAGNLSIVQFGKIFPFTPCFDVSGVVEDVGANCKRIKKGDEVWAMSSISCGGAADYVVLQEKNVALKPSSLSHTEAASIPLVGQTNYQALVETAKIKEGQKVLILGGSGGTGSNAIQLAKHYKCDVTVTCSERNLEFVRAMGADHTIDYAKENWWEVLKGGNFDIVYDTVGGAGVWDRSAHVLKKDGVFVTIAAESEETLTVGRAIAAGASIVNRKFWSVFGFPKYHLLTTSPNWTDLFDLRKLIDEDHAIRPVVERVYPLEEAPAAFAEHIKRKTRGKIVIQVVPDDQVQVPSSCFSGLASASSSSSSSSSPSAEATSSSSSSSSSSSAPDAVVGQEETAASEPPVAAEETEKEEKEEKEKEKSEETKEEKEEEEEEKKSEEPTVVAVEQTGPSAEEGTAPTSEPAADEETVAQAEEAVEEIDL